MKITKKQLRQIIKEETTRLNERVTQEQVEAKQKMYKDFYDYLDGIFDTDLVTSYNQAQEALYTALIAKATELQEQYNPGAYYDLAGDVQKTSDEIMALEKAMVKKVISEK
jgi:hypothetical protein